MWTKNSLILGCFCRVFKQQQQQKNNLPWFEKFPSIINSIIYNSFWLRSKQKKTRRKDDFIFCNFVKKNKLLFFLLLSFLQRDKRKRRKINISRIYSIFSSSFDNNIVFFSYLRLSVNSSFFSFMGKEKKISVSYVWFFYFILMFDNKKIKKKQQQIILTRYLIVYSRKHKMN